MRPERPPGQLAASECRPDIWERDDSARINGGAGLDKANQGTLGSAALPAAQEPSCPLIVLSDICYSSDGSLSPGVSLVGTPAAGGPMPLPDPPCEGLQGVIACCPDSCRHQHTACSDSTELQLHGTQSDLQVVSPPPAMSAAVQPPDKVKLLQLPATPPAPPDEGYRGFNDAANCWQHMSSYVGRQSAPIPLPYTSPSSTSQVFVKIHGIEPEDLTLACLTTLLSDLNNMLPGRWLAGTCLRQGCVELTLEYVLSDSSATQGDSGRLGRAGSGSSMELPASEIVGQLLQGFSSVPWDQWLSDAGVQVPEGSSVEIQVEQGGVVYACRAALTSASSSPSPADSASHMDTIQHMSMRTSSSVSSGSSSSADEQPLADTPAPPPSSLLTSNTSLAAPSPPPPPLQPLTTYSKSNAVVVAAVSPCALVAFPATGEQQPHTAPRTAPVHLLTRLATRRSALKAIPGMSSTQGVRFLVRSQGQDVPVRLQLLPPPDPASCGQPKPSQETPMHWRLQQQQVAALLLAQHTKPMPAGRGKLTARLSPQAIASLQARRVMAFTSAITGGAVINAWEYLDSALGQVQPEDDLVFTNWCLTLDVSGLSPPCSLHLEVKADNILLDSQTLVLLDAGSASLAPELQELLLCNSASRWNSGPVGVHKQQLECVQDGPVLTRHNSTPLACSISLGKQVQHSARGNGPNSQMPPLPLYRWAASPITLDDDPAPGPSHKPDNSTVQLGGAATAHIRTGAACNSARALLTDLGTWLEYCCACQKAESTYNAEYVSVRADGSHVSGGGAEAPGAVAAAAAAWAPGTSSKDAARVLGSRLSTLAMTAAIKDPLFRHHMVHVGCSLLHYAVAAGWPEMSTRVLATLLGPAGCCTFAEVRQYNGMHLLDRALMSGRAGMLRTVVSWGQQFNCPWSWPTMKPTKAAACQLDDTMSLFDDVPASAFSVANTSRSSPDLQRHQQPAGQPGGGCKDEAGGGGEVCHGSNQLRGTAPGGEISAQGMEEEQWFACDEGEDGQWGQLDGHDATRRTAAHHHGSATLLGLPMALQHASAHLQALQQRCHLVAAQLTARMTASVTPFAGLLASKHPFLKPGPMRLAQLSACGFRDDAVEQQYRQYTLQHTAPMLHSWAVVLLLMLMISLLRSVVYGQGLHEVAALVIWSAFYPMTIHMLARRQYQHLGTCYFLCGLGRSASMILMGMSYIDIPESVQAVMHVHLEFITFPFLYTVFEPMFTQHMIIYRLTELAGLILLQHRLGVSYCTYLSCLCCGLGAAVGITLDARNRHTFTSSLDAAAASGVVAVGGALARKLR